MEGEDLRRAEPVAAFADSEASPPPSPRLSSSPRPSPSSRSSLQPFPSLGPSPQPSPRPSPQPSPRGRGSQRLEFDALDEPPAVTGRRDRARGATELPPSQTLPPSPSRDAEPSPDAAPSPRRETLALFAADDFRDEEPGDASVPPLTASVPHLDDVALRRQGPSVDASPEATPETVVRVKIGRVEVRATPSAVPAPRRRRAATPKLGLGDYLKARNEARR